MTEKASLILYNANVLTMDTARPGASLVAIQGNRILATGDNALLSQLQGPDTDLVDCEGKTLIPGFIDAHCHVLAFARGFLAVDCTPASVRSIEDLKARIRHHADQTPQGTWIKGTGYNEFYLEEKRHPTRHDLDKATTNHPVVINHRSGHLCVLNSLGLKAAGISDETPEPPGAVIDRELDTGLPSGLLYETNYIVDSTMLAPTEVSLSRAVEIANKQYLSLGITSLHDATADNGYDRWQIFQRIKQSGEIASRITMMIGSDSIEEFNTQRIAQSCDSNAVQLGAVKFLITESTGVVFPSQIELNEAVLQVHKSGFQVALHAIEEDTIDVAIATLENAAACHFRNNHRHRIEHCSECTPSQLKRLKALDAVIVTQPSFIYFSGERYLSQVPVSQQPWLYRIGSFWKSGIMTAAGSDSPVVACNPLVGIYSAVTRKAESGQDLLPAERISPLHALAMYTINAAYASFEEHIKGSISPGKLADLVLLSDDPTTAQEEDIKGISVEKTIIDGRIAWERE